MLEKENIYLLYKIYVINSNSSKCYEHTERVMGQSVQGDGWHLRRGGQKASLGRLSDEKEPALLCSRERVTQEEGEAEAKLPRQGWGWRVLRIEKTIIEVAM